ncbi:MAG: twin-arginine translocation signal domain-containing protein, partial [Arenimonas sp.]
MPYRSDLPAFGNLNRRSFMQTASAVAAAGLLRARAAPPAALDITF